jgi:hypothetical protein
MTVRMAERVGVVVALSLLCLFAFAPTPSAKGDGGVDAAASPALIRWKAGKAGIGFPQDLTSRYLVSNGPGNQGWTDYPARDLFLYDMKLGVTRQLTSSPETEAIAALWDDNVIYATGPNPHAEQAGPWSVSLYHISTGDTRVVASYEDASSVWNLQAASGYAAWTVSVGDTMDLWLYDFASGAPVCLSSDGAHRVTGLSLADGRLAWIDGSSLFLYDLASKAKTVISTTEGDSAHLVSVAGDKVGWLRERQLRLYDIASGETEVVADRADDFDLTAQHVVWMVIADAEGSLDTADIYLRDLSASTEQRLTNNSVADGQPQVSDRFVVWMQGDYRDASLLAYDLESGFTSTITPEGPEGAAGFHLEGDRVAWCQWRGLGHVYLARAVTFLDVDPDGSFGRAVAQLANAGVIGGYPDGTFRPDQPLKRAQFAKMIVLGLGLPVTEGGTALPFQDVEKPAGDLYPDDYVAVAAANGLFQGYAGGAFRPYVSVSRAQLLTIVVRAAQRFRPAALTEPPAGWHGTLPAGDATHGRNVAEAEYNGLLDGVDLPAFALSEDTTRGEVAQILCNLLNKLE